MSDPNRNGRKGCLIKLTSDVTIEQFAELRPLLFSIAYRMTGSRADADDILQEAFLRWQRVELSTVESPRAFLTTVVSRLSLDTLKAAYRKREVYAGPWLPEPIVGPVSEPLELAESLSFAFLHVLESLSAQERVAFLMREVFDAEYKEIASVLDTGETNVRKLVSRAREHLRERRPRKTCDAQSQAPLLAAFMQACAEGDSSTLVQLLKDDATLYTDGGGRVNAARNPIYGAERIIRFILGVRAKGLGRFSGYPLLVNGAPGAVVTLNGAPNAIVTFELEDNRIHSLYYVLNPDKFPESITVATSDDTV